MDRSSGKSTPHTPSTAPLQNSTRFTVGESESSPWQHQDPKRKECKDDKSISHRPHVMSLLNTTCLTVKKEAQPSSTSRRRGSSSNTRDDA